MTKLDKPIFFRFLLSVALAGATLALFLNRSKPVTTPPAKQIEHTPQDILSTAVEIDREVDSVLSQFKIEKEWSRKRQINIPNTDFFSTERRVWIPMSVQTVQLNLVLNTMAHRYNGRAIASENTKEKSVKIHVVIEGYIVQTIILTHRTDLRRVERRSIQKNA